ncbi:MAG: ABC transporter ATP-binding protein [Planctomycetales bacterium]|nr:ABC transporter ATP-binding protein [Planctomycetales bacterium]
MKKAGENSTSSDSILIRAENLRKVYTDGNVTALDGVSLEIRAGEYISIMGPSGSGKSTLLHMLGGLDRPTSGEVYIQGEAVSKMASLDEVRSRLIGFVFQSFHLLPNLTVCENVQLPMFETKMSPAEREARAKELLPVVGIEHREKHLASKLSVGERQRVAIARALANRPIVLLADEPTGNLDSKTGHDILELFDKLNREHNTTIVMITHDKAVGDRATRQLFFKDGNIQETSDATA